MQGKRFPHDHKTKKSLKNNIYETHISGTGCINFKTVEISTDRGSKQTASQSDAGDGAAPVLVARRLLEDQRHLVAELLAPRLELAHVRRVHHDADLIRGNPLFLELKLI